MTQPASQLRLQRWPGSWYGVATKSFVWGTPDFLLVVDRELFVERYRRLDFRDLLAVWIQPIRVRELWWGFATVMILGAAIAFVVRGDAIGWRIAGSVLLVLGMLLSGLAVWTGPTCAVWLVSDVGPIRVRAWSRRVTFDRVWPQLQQRVAAAQGELPSLSATDRTLPASPPRLLAGASVRAGTTPPSPRTLRFWLWSTVAGLWIAALGWAVTAGGWTPRTVTLTGFGVLVAVVTSLAALLVTASGRGLRSYRRWAGISLAINLALWGLVYVMQMIVYLNALNPQQTAQPSPLITTLIPATAAVVSAVAGLVGVAFLRRPS